MAEDTKKIARLDFDIDKALSGLDKIDTKLKTISESSEKYAKKIGQSLNSGIDKRVVDNNIKVVEKSYDGLSKYEKNRAADVAAYKEKQAIKTTEALKREHAKQEKSVETLYDRISKYASTYIIYQGFNKLKQSATETIEEMVNVEYQMIAIDRVLNESSLDVDHYRDKLMELAYDYGNSFDNVADITLRLAQAGFNSQEAIALTEKTLLALNTAELDATQATDDMVAVMAQWGLMTGTASEKAKSYGDIIDKINKVADKFPTTSADIMDALKKVSSAFNLAGADIDETIATIVAAEKASQRGGKVIGTALSNITQQLKAEKKLDLAEQLGLNFFKDAKKTEFKPIMEIFQEMADRMEQLKSQGKESSTEMQQLLELFTVFRRNIGASLLGEMAGGEESTYMQVYKTSIDSVGYSLQENEKYMKSAKAAQEQFNTTLLQLKTAVWDNGLEDVFRSMLMLGNDVTKTIKLLIDTFGSVPTAIGVATMAMTAFNKQLKVQVSYKSGEGFGINNDFLNKIKQADKDVKALTSDVLQLGNAKVKANAALTQYTEKVGIANVSTRGYISYLVKQKAATIAAEAATLALNTALSLGLSAGITLIISGIDKLIHAEENAAKKAQERVNTAKDLLDSYEKERNSLNELIKEYDELAKKSSRTPEEGLRIHEIQTQINSLIKDQKESIDLVNGAYDETIKKLKQISSEETERSLKQADIAKKAAENQLEDYGDFGLDKFEKAFDRYGINLMEIQKKILPGTILKRSPDTLLKAADYETTIHLLEQFKEKLEEADATSEDFYYKIIEDLKTMYGLQNNVNEATDTYNNILAEKVYSNILNKGSQEPSSIQSQFGNIDINREGITWDDKNIEKYRGQLQELNIDLENLKGSYSNILGASNAFNTEMGEVEIAYSPMLQTDKGLVPLYQDEVNEYIQEVLNKAQDAVNNGEYSNLKDAVLGIDAQGIDEFVNTEGDKIKGLIADVGDTAEETGKQMHENWELISKSFGKTVDNAEEFSTLLNNINSLDLDDLKEMGIDTEGIDNLSDLQNKLIELAKTNFPDFIGQTKETNDTLKEMTDTLRTTAEITKELGIDNLSKQMANLQSQYSILTTAQKELNTSGEITAATFKNLVDNNLINYLDVVNGKVVVNTDNMAAMAEETKIAAIESLKAAASEDIHKLALGKEADMSVTAKNAIANFGDSASNAGGKARNAAGAILELASALAQAAAANSELAGENNVSDFSAKAAAISSAYQGAAKKIGAISISSASSSGGSSRRSGSGGSSGRSSGSSSKASEAQKKKEEDYKKRLEKFTSTLEKMEDKEEDWVKKQKELGLLSNSDMLYVTQQRISKYNQYLNKIKKATWMNKEDRKKIQEEYTKKLKDLQLEYFDYLKGKLEDETKAIEKSRDERIKALEEETKNRKKLIEDEADARIAALKKVSDSRDRDREKEDYEKERQQILDEIAYWQQRTGREAVENLAKAKEKLKELDDDWAEKVEDWNTDDLIKSIEEQRDAQIKALEAESEKRKENIENEAQAQIDAIQSTYDAKVKAFSESNKIIYDDSVIAAKNLYDAYKKEFVDPLKSDLKNINKKSVTYTVKKGDTLESIAKKYNTTVKKIKSANNLKKDKIKKGQKLKIPMYHQGGIFSGAEEGLALLKKGEWVLRPEWSNSMNRMMKYFDNVTQGKVSGLPMGNNSTIEVERKSD